MRNVALLAARTGDRGCCRSSGSERPRANRRRNTAKARDESLPLRLGRSCGSLDRRLPGRDRLRRRLSGLRAGHQYGAPARTGGDLQRAPPHAPVGRRLDPGMRRAPERAERPAWDLLFRHVKSAQAAIPVLHQRQVLEHHRRLLSAAARRLSDHPDGLGQRRRARAGRRVRSQAPPGRLVARVAPDRRVQPARHFRPARVEPDDDERLHPARLDPERRSRALLSCATRSGSGISRSARS